MKPKMLWKLAVKTNPEAEDAVAELIERSIGQPASSYTDADSGAVTISAYLQHRSQWSESKRREIASGLARIAATDVNVDPGAISFRRMPQQDWAESWKLHFKPVVISRRLLLKPTWSRRRPGKGEAVVVLDPGLSFGTGRHPTTSFCLRQLVAHRSRHGGKQACLDIGTGSGILAIAAAKLGYRAVDALDYDPESIRVARANARRNRVASRIGFRRADLTRLPRRSGRQYDVVCANLVANLLLAEQKRILARLHPHGMLVVAGILKEEFRRIQKAYETAGLRLIASRAEDEWQSGAFAWKT